MTRNGMANERQQNEMVHVLRGEDGWRGEVMTTYHCSKEAYFRCPNRQYCGTQEEAEFVEGSECAEFNRKQVKTGKLVPDRQVVYCSQCKHRATKVKASEGFVFCTYWGHRLGCGLVSMKSDGFCSHGELEDNNGTTD